MLSIEVMAMKPRKRDATRLPPAAISASIPQMGVSTASSRVQSSAFHLVCESCGYRCAVDAKFCAKCGDKLKQNAFGVLRTKLPSLDKLWFAQPSTVTSPSRVAMPSAASPFIKAPLPPTAKKRPLVAAKKPTRITKLRSIDPPTAAAHGTTSRLEDQLNTQEREQNHGRDVDLDLKLKMWMVSTRRLVESLLELKRRLDRPELEALDGAQFQSIDHVVHALDSDLQALEPAFSLDRNLQVKCFAMLAKLKELRRSTQQRLMTSIDTLTSTQYATQELRPPPSKLDAKAVISDADLTIRGPDGKRMFFKARVSPTKAYIHEITTHSPVVKPVDVSIVDLLHKPRRQKHTRAGEDAEEVRGVDPSPQPKMPAVSQFVRSRWTDMLLVRVCRVDGRVVVLRLSESDEVHQLVVDIYRPLTSLSVSVTLPLEWLEFILPPLLTWYRVSEVRRYRAVEAHWSRCFDHVVRCLKWKPGNEITVCLPIQYRQACMFTFRSFAIFYGFLSVQLIPHDYSLRISFLNARTGQRTVLSLLEKHIVRVLRGPDSYRERLVGRTTRKTLYAQVCEKLYFEYTSRGFELVFPGVKPKGSLRRHPQEISIKQHRAEMLEQERKDLTTMKYQCIQQAVVLARRRMAEYDERMRRLKKEKQESAAKKIQARTRGLVAKKKMRRKREEMRRSTQLQDLAAMLIQQKYRKRRDADRQARAKQLQMRDATGLRFRLCCRINSTFAMAIVTLDEIDAAANAFDCIVRIVHPVTLQTAQLRVAYADLLRLTAKSSLREWSRRGIIETLLKQHLDVFRSVKHNVLVLALCS